MDNIKYICTNPACESYYEAVNTEFTQEEVVNGATSETCCPNCGNPLTPLPYYLEEKEKARAAKRKKLIKLIVISLVGLIVIVSAILLFTSKKGSEQIGQQTAQEVEQAPVNSPQQDEIRPETETIEQTEQQAPPTAKKEDKKTTTPKHTQSGNQSKTFSDGSKYVGEIKNGKMHGLGTYYYGERQLISPKDLKKRYAEKGDYLIGEFYEGNVVSGKLYDSQNNVKEVIMIGR